MKTRSPWVRHFKLFAVLCVALLGQGLFIHPAHAQILSDKDKRFSVISRGPGLLDIFIVNGPTNEIWMKSWTGSIWTNWRNLGRAANGDPLYNVYAVASGNNRWDIFSTSGGGGTLGPVWHKSFDGTVEYGWESRGSVGEAFPGGIQAVSTGNGQINLFTRYTGSGGRAPVLTKRRNANGSWVPCSTCAWTVIDTNSAEERYNFSALAHSGNRLDLFKSSESDNNIFQKSFNGTYWTLGPWFYMYGQSRSTPYPVSWGTNRIDVFVRGVNDRNVYINNSDDAGVHWNGWGFLGRGATNNTTDVAGISAVAWGPNRLDLFTREATTLYYKAWTGSYWWPSQTTWENLGFMASYVTGHPPLPVSWGPSRIDLFYYHDTPNGAPNTQTLYHKWTNGNGWGPSQTEWESLGPY
ncbi:MAG TPA: hypothetical protein VFX02_11535 [Gammaproteobacteria bacterium]|nr:hypothetical protein [Gammaproteobacteria bacterium]